MDKETLRMQMLSGVITESEYKEKLNENETAEKLFQVFKDEGLLNDRREYDAEDFMLAYPDLSQEEAEKLEKMLQNPANLNEHYVAGGIVGIGAINQIPSRAKADYEDAFEHFLSQKYDLNEIEKEVEEGNLGHNVIASLTPEGRFWIVSWRGMDGDKEKVFTDEDEARAFMNTLEEGKEVEEAMVNPNTSDRVSYLESALDHVWNMGKNNNSIDFEDMAKSIVNDMFDDLEEGKEEKLNEGNLDGLYMELKNVLFPYYTDLTGKERIDMIDDVIKELNSYILILQDEKKAKQ